MYLQLAWHLARRSILTSFTGVVERVTTVCQKEEAWTPQDAASNWHGLGELVWTMLDMVLSELTKVSTIKSWASGQPAM